MRLDESPGTILIVAAHPDDETVGAGAHLSSWRGRVHIVHVTDGSPRDLKDALKAGCPTREEYADLRRQEVLKALALAGVAAGRWRSAGVVDQEASLALPAVTRHIRAVLDEVRPAFVLTHPYEGGHPDHDACSFAVQAATQARSEIEVWEFASYHAGPDGIETGRFLPNSPNTVFSMRLDAADRERKRAMIECFSTQLHMLASFGLEQEIFRRAPAYDFTRPPHEGRLFYENFPWGMTGVRWRELAAAALAEARAANGS